MLIELGMWVNGRPPPSGLCARGGLALFGCRSYKQLQALRVALAAHYEKETNNRALVQTAKAA